MGLSYADTQWTLPANATPEEKAWADKGLSWQTRLWIDDMFMITILQAQAYHTTGKREYMDRAVKEMVVYLDELQRPNGLFYHAPDVPYFWARGNGWMAVGMAELLLSTPEDNPNHARILEGYRLMMKSLKDYQDKSGMWNQLIDKADCWPETSGSAMFTYAMIMGVKMGWLEAEEYGPIARKAWIALVIRTEMWKKFVSVLERRMIFSIIMTVLGLLATIMDRLRCCGVLMHCCVNNDCRKIITIVISGQY